MATPRRYDGGSGPDADPSPAAESGEAPTSTALPSGIRLVRRTPRPEPPPVDVEVERLPDFSGREETAAAAPPPGDPPLARLPFDSSSSESLELMVATFEPEAAPPPPPAAKQAAWVDPLDVVIVVSIATIFFAAGMAAATFLH